jgi:effector-binding domain-containing protein
MAVEIHTVGASKTAVVAGPFDLAKLMPSFDAVYAWLRGQTEVKQVGQNIALYRHGKEMEVGVEVDRSFEPAAGVRPSELPAGRVATATHTTGYADMRRTYDAIAVFCRKRGLETTGIAWEIYGDPDEHGHADVEIRFLLA